MATIAISACAQEQTAPAQNEPPPMPEGAETVEFVYPETTESRTEANDTASAPSAMKRDPSLSSNTNEKPPVYWGVKDGEPLTIMWEDLMPEGSEEDLIREYEEFYAMLEQRYAANTTTLVDAADPYAAIEEGSEFDFMPQLGTFDTVPELNGQLVRIPGYVVPFDFKSNARLREFLFVPYMGACIHTPPPPPNQIVFVRADPAVRIKDIWVPYWLEGTLSTQNVENELGDAAYVLKLDRVKPYLSP